MKRRYTHIVPRLLAMLAILMTGNMSYAQFYGNYTQYITNDLVLNPAYAGSDDALSLAFANRLQWAAVEGAPTTQTFSGHSLFRTEKVGLGLTLINENIGVHHRFTTQGSYAYRIKFDKTKVLAFGLQFGFISSISDYLSLDPDDPVLTGSGERKTNFTFGTGMIYKSEKLFLSLSAPNLYGPRPGLDSSIKALNGTEYLLGARYKIPVNLNLTLTPAMLLRYMDGSPFSYNLAIAGTYNEAIVLAFSYTSSKKLSGIMQFQVSRQFKIGYSYDHELLRYEGLTAGSHELMLQFLFKYKRSKLASPR